MPDLDEDRLLEAAKAGSRQALEELLTRQEARIYRFGLRMCGDPEDAKDVMQETLFAMTRGLQDFRGASSLSTWLYAIARSFCIKRRRKSKFAPEEEHSLESSAAPEVAHLRDPHRPDEALAAKELDHALEEAVGGLAPQYREVLVLRDVEGLTAPEVAEVLGIGVPAVKSRLHRARLSVRQRLAPLLEPAATPPAGPGSCPDVLTLFSRHLEDEIGPETCASMERHLETCARCRGACDSLRRTLALCRTSASEVAVPAAVQASVKVAVRRFLAEGA